MMDTQTHASIIALWPNVPDLASDIGCNEAAVRKWVQRKSIPAEHWVALVSSAKKRGIKGVTLDLLARIAASKLSGAA